MTLKYPWLLGRWLMLLRCCTCDSSSFTIRQKIGQGIMRNGGFGEAMGESGREPAQDAGSYLAEHCWYHQFFCWTSLLLALLSSGLWRRVPASRWP